MKKLLMKVADLMKNIIAENHKWIMKTILKLVKSFKMFQLLDLINRL
jgi:hypothetical protein